MKLYNCQVRLSGNVNHVVPKYAVTEPEILVLRNMHGNDAVVNLKRVGEDLDRTEIAEYRRLAGIYTQPKIEELFMVKLDLDAIIVEEVDDDEPEIVLPASVQATMAKPATQNKVV